MRIAVLVGIAAILLLNGAGLAVLCFFAVGRYVRGRKAGGTAVAGQDGEAPGQHNDSLRSVFCTGCGQALPPANEVCCRCGLPVCRTAANRQSCFPGSDRSMTSADAETCEYGGN